MEKDTRFYRFFSSSSMQSFGGGKPKRLGRGPRFLTCHICGQQFGKSSLAIHEKACAKKWRDRESKKPKREQRPVPQKAAALCAADGMGVDEYNALAQKEWDHNLTQCQFCQRTFREEAFKHHQKACGPGNAMKKVGVRANASGVGLGAAARARQRGAFGEEYPSAASSQERIECQYCSRKFAPQSIDRHVQVCAKVKHKPTKPPTSNSAFTDELGVRHGGRGGLATSAARQTTSATAAASPATATAALVLGGGGGMKGGDALTKAVGISADSSSFKMLMAAVDTCMEIGASPQQVQQAVSRALKKYSV
jgi:hypothetical protein